MITPELVKKFTQPLPSEDKSFTRNNAFPKSNRCRDSVPEFLETPNKFPVIKDKIYTWHKADNNKLLSLTKHKTLCLLETLSNPTLKSKIKYNQRKLAC